MMTPRLIEMRRVLKPTGTLYLHCDPRSSHYLKLILDGVLDADSFRNEIIWKRTTPKGLAFTRFAGNHDVILFAADRTHDRHPQRPMQAGIAQIVACCASTQPATPRCPSAAAAPH